MAWFLLAFVTVNIMLPFPPVQHLTQHPRRFFCRNCTGDSLGWYSLVQQTLRDVTNLVDSMHRSWSSVEGQQEHSASSVQDFHTE